MEGSELFAQARAQAQGISSKAPERELERLREDCQDFFGTVPEPPLYRRVDDPVRAQARALLPKGTGLLARAYALEEAGGPAHVGLLREALEAHLSALEQTAQGKLRPAELSFALALEKEAQAFSARRAWKRTDEELPPVFDKQTGQSRYDPRPETQVKVQLACPVKACHQMGPYAFTPAFSTHRFTCRACHAPFLVFFGEAKEAQMARRGQGKHYRLTLEELGGGSSRVEFDEPSGAVFHLARRDLIALIYTEDRELKGVLNLTSSRLMWLPQGGPCFLATAAFGEGAPELVAFRALRDEVLQKSAVGAWLVRGYYRVGPVLARPLARSPWRRAAMRLALRPVRAAISRSGIGREVR